MNLQNIKGQRADQPAKKRATPYRIHALPLLNRCGLKQLIFKNEYLLKTFYAMVQSELCN